MRNHGTCTYCQAPAINVVALKLQVDRDPEDHAKVKLRVVSGSKRTEEDLSLDRCARDTPHTPACQEHIVLLFRAGLNGDGAAMETLYKDMHTKLDALMREVHG